MFKYFIYKFGQFIVNILPEKMAYGFAVFLSDLHYFLSFRDRRAVKNNLKVIVGASENLPGLARQVFRNFGKYLVEFFRIPNSVNKKFVEHKMHFENKNYLDDGLKAGRGVILLTAHIGNWELGGVSLGLLGYPIKAIALPHKERPVNDLFNGQREIKGVTVIPTNVAIRQCFEALKRNEVIALLADRDFSLNGEVLDFLGKKTIIPKGAAVFSRRMNAPIVPTFIIRRDDDSFSFRFEPPIYPDLQKSEEDGILETMVTYTATIEREIRKYPTQWLMFREFWKNEAVHSDPRS